MPTTEDRPALAAARALRIAIRKAGGGVPLTSILSARSPLGRRYRGMLDEFTGALGGENHISPQRRLLLEQLCRVAIIVDALDASLLASGLDVGSAETRKFFKDVNSARHLMSQLAGQLGLDRVAAPVESPLEILRAELEGAAPTGDKRTP